MSESGQSRLKRWISIRRVLITGLGVSAVLLAILALRERDRRRRDESAAFEWAREQSALGVQSLDRVLEPIQPEALKLARDIGVGHLRGNALIDRLRQTVENGHSFFIEAGAAYAPYAYDPTVELYAPHYLRLDGIGRVYQREAFGNYREREWFRVAMVRGPAWSEPEVGRGSGQLIVGLSVPFFLGPSPTLPSGIVRIDTAVGLLQDAVSGLTAGRTHYGALISAGGVYISHPLAGHVQQQRTIFDDLLHSGDRGLRECVRRALAGERGSTEGLSELTQKPAWIFCEPVPVTHWALVMVYEKAELLVPSAELKHAQLYVLLAALLLGALFACVVLRVETGRVPVLWTASLTLSLLLAAGLATLWNRLREARVSTPPGRTEIFDHASLRACERANAQQVQGVKSVDSAFIPAGLYVSTLNLSRPGEAVVTGYAWQKYRVGAQDKIARGFILPDAEQVSFTEAYHRVEAGEDVVGWSFRATLRQSYSDASKYPFDGASLRIRMWHREFDKAIVLVPDLDAYTLMIPSSLPGLEETLTLPGWSIQQTFFDYAKTNLDTDFGIRTFTGQVGAPELGFNIIAKREFLDPFFASLMPIAVVDCILFVLLLCGTRDEKGRDRFGFKPMTALSVAAGTLFVILVAHNNMRSRVAATQIIFLEFFYFLAYATIILVAANAIAVTRVNTLKVIHTGDNLAPKVGFWPITLAAFLAVTIAVFY